MPKIRDKACSLSIFSEISGEVIGNQALDNWSILSFAVLKKTVTMIILSSTLYYNDECS